VEGQGADTRAAHALKQVALSADQVSGGPVQTGATKSIVMHTSTAVGWSLGQRALLRFLQREGVLTEEPSAPTGGPASNGELFARLASSIDQSGLVSLVADSLRVPSVDLDTEALMQDLISLLTPEVAAACEMIPVAQYDDTLEVATANPLDVEALKTVEFTTGLRVRARVTTRASVLRALATWYGIAAAAPAEDDANGTATISIAAEPIELPTVAESEREASAPVVEEPPDDDAPLVRWTGPAGVVVVAADLGVRLQVSAVLAADALEIAVMTVRDAAEAWAVAGTGRVHVLVVDATREAIDEPAWQCLASEAGAALVVLADAREAESAQEPSDAGAPITPLDALVARVRRLLIDQRGDPT
jgi:hypothetical protein